MSPYRKRIAASRIILALFAATSLAACGGGGGSSGSIDSAPPMSPVSGLFATAQGAESAAAAAGMAARQAVADAETYAAMLGVVAVKGESATAKQNAQKVLGARMAAGQAVTDANAALKIAEDALVDANGLDVDTPDRASLISALEDAITHARAQVTVAEDARDGIALEDAVAAVIGTDPNDPETPDDRAEDVAKAIEMAIDETATIMDGNLGGILSEAGANQVLFAMEDRQGRTWEEIVGTANIMQARVGADNALAPLASIAGLAASDVHAGQLQDTGTYTDGQEIADANHAGIPGSAFCLGTDCTVESGVLTGSWYFSPTFPEETYLRLPGAGDYMEETMYARFGYWLEVDGTGAVTYNTYADMGDPSVNSQAGTGLVGASQTLAGTADYSGDAVGFSVLETFSGGRQAGIASGAFTADVTLTATFGNNAMVRGTIDNFQGNAVNSGWTVMLQDTALYQTGVADGGGTSGAWKTGTHGAADERPAGIFGTFNAHFSDGHAAGAFATRKE